MEDRVLYDTILLAVDAKYLEEWNKEVALEACQRIKANQLYRENLKQS